MAPKKTPSLSSNQLPFESLLEELLGVIVSDTAVGMCELRGHPSLPIYLFQHFTDNFFRIYPRMLGHLQVSFVLSLLRYGHDKTRS